MADHLRFRVDAHSLLLRRVSEQGRNPSLPVGKSPWYLALAMNGQSPPEMIQKGGRWFVKRLGNDSS